MPSKRHSDHDYIVARQKRYIKAWNEGSVEKLMQFMEIDEINYSNFDMFQQTFSQYDNLKLTTRSLHGHKHFTAWEWAISCKEAKASDDTSLEDEGRRHNMIGCTLMWWNDNDKIIKNHEYCQIRDPEDDVHANSSLYAIEPDRSPQLSKL